MLRGNFENREEKNAVNKNDRFGFKIYIRTFMAAVVIVGMFLFAAGCSDRNAASDQLASEENTEEIAPKDAEPQEDAQEAASVDH